MNDNDIIKALECCGIFGIYHCDIDCPMMNNGITNVNACKRELNIKAIELITRQKAKIEALEMDNAQLQSDNINANMNREHLQAEIDKQYEQAESDILGNIADGGTACHWCIDENRKAAIKEFCKKRGIEYVENDI